MRSTELFERAKRRVPGGVHSNSRLRAPHPVFAARAEGAHLWDVDGRRWLDCTMGNASVILGHAHPGVQEAVHAAVSSGVTTGSETAAAVEAVELLAEIVPGCGSVRFANTGTEAAMHALAIARHATGRPAVAKAESSYHGWSDPLWVSTWPPPAQWGPTGAPAAVPSSAGLAPDAADTLVLPFNDADGTEALLRRNADRLAAVFVEPVLIDIGYVPATPGYLRRLREVTAELGIVLVFDELLTGFRVAPGGARELYGVRADLTLFGKAIANGYPVAAVEGDPALIASTDPTAGGPVGWVGTYNGHAVAMAAVTASLTALRDGSVHGHLVQLTDRLREGFERRASAHGVPARLAGGGGHFQPYFTAEPVDDYRTATATDATRYAALLAETVERGILIVEKPLLHCALSAAHTEADVDLLLDAAEASFSGRPSATATAR
ncbi:aspartate aminotransferase family protein [Streptosporangium soli]|nr:aspartate aminotransferase family protein [Streptosporangium sp. KLBMP 9127]